MAQQPPRYSPDGKWWWDGQQWQPVQQPQPVSGLTPARRRRGPNSWIVGGIFAGLFLIIVVLIGVAAALTPTSSSTTGGTSGTSQGGLGAVAAPTATPTPSPFSPVTLTGQGSKVTDPFHLPAGTYRVSWSAQGGPDNLIVHVHRGTAEQGLVNEIPANPSSGEASLTVDDGDYFLSVEAATLKWLITLTKVA